MARDVTVTFTDGTTAIYKGVPDDITPEGVIQRATSENKKGVAEVDGGKPGGVGAAVKEVGRVADQTVRGGVTALPGTVGDAALGVARSPKVLDAMGPMGMATKLAMKIPGLADIINERKWGDATQALQTAGGALPPVSEPQTKAGKIIGGIGESAVSAATGGGAGTMGSRAVIGAGGGAGAEAAGAAFDDNPIAKVLGALLGGAGTAVAQAWKPNAKQLIQESTSQMKDSDWAKAKVLKELADRQGLPTVSSQLLGPRSTLDDVVTQASADPTARGKLITHVEGAQKAANKAMQGIVEQKLPITLGERTQALDDIQGAAKAHIESLKSNANKDFVAAMPETSLGILARSIQRLFTTSSWQWRNLQSMAELPSKGRQSLAFAEQLVKS
jgi:hypothetical protein